MRLAKSAAVKSNAKLLACIVVVTHSKRHCIFGKQKMQQQPNGILARWGSNQIEPNSWVFFSKRLFMQFEMFIVD